MRAAALLLLLACAASSVIGQASPPPRPPAPAPAPVESTGQALLDQQDEALAGRAYTYDPAGRRDPFRSLLVRS
ncbi:MAG TPA: hypothetical protein VIY96_00370, partial [Thermoanaerobaculia bacterium]